MKGLMVTLLTLCAASFAAAQESASSNGGGKFILRLTDELIADLKVNPGGLSALIAPEDQGKITEVLILYRPPTRTPVTTTTPTSQQTVGRQDFDTNPFQRSTRPTLDPPARSTETRPLPRFGSSTPAPSTERTLLASNDEPLPGQEWLPVGDYTDFVPVTRKEDWIRDLPSGITPAVQTADNRNNFDNRNFNSNIPRITAQADQFTRDVNLGDRNQLVQSQEQLRQLQLKQEQYEQKMLEYQDRLALQQRQFDQQLALERSRTLELERNRNTQQYGVRDNRLAYNDLNRSTVGLDNYVERNSQVDQAIMQKLDRLGYEIDDIKKRDQEETYSMRMARLNEERALNNASIPGRRLASNDQELPRPSSLNAQIPGPNQANQEPRNRGSSYTGTQSELVANMNSLKRTNGFLLFMLLCSVGINIYLGLISRSFYTRYSELADELRETFTATM